MDDLNNFIAAWEETGSIASVLEKGLTLPPPDKVLSYLASLPEAEQAHIRKSLANAVDALEEYAAFLEKEAAEINIRLDESVKTARACLSYSSAGASRQKQIKDTP